MKISTDSFYWIGDEHKECQDYATTGVYGNLAYAIVCDGCSSAKGVDFGARLLAHSFESFVPMIAGMTHNLTHTAAEAVGIAVILEAQKALGMFPRISRNALCATLMVAITDGRRLHCYTYGDGMVYLKHRGKGYHAQMLSYPTGAPYYLWYRLNAADAQAYHDNFLGDMHNLLIEGEAPDEKGRLLDRIAHPYKTIGVVDVDIAAEEIECVGLTSDGIGSFEAQKEGEQFKPVPAWEMIPEFFGFRSWSGDFVQRRIQAMEKARRKAGTKHHDDVSVAAIHFEP